MKYLKYCVLLIMVLVFIQHHIQAQSVISSESVLSNLSGIRTISRVFGSPAKTMTYYYEKTSYKNVFVFPNTSPFNMANRFALPDEAGVGGGITYTINDIVIIGEMCYFCGKKKFENGYQYDLNNNIIIMYDSVGFVGRFSLSNVTPSSGASLKYSMRTIAGTLDIKQMDKYTSVNRQDTLLGMTGVANDASKTSCLIFMKGAGSAWQSHVRLASSTTETFTDVIFTDKRIVAVSRKQGETMKFYLRSAITEDVFDNQLYSDLDDMNEFFTGGMHVWFSSDTPTWHYDNVQMRLCSIPESDEFYVAHESFFPIPTYGVTKNNISLYKMDAQNAQYQMNRIDMPTAQFVEGDISDTGTFADMAFLNYNNSTSTLLLHQTTNSTATYKSILQVASWSNIGTITNLVNSSNSFKSIDVRENRYIYASGIMPGSNDKIVRLFQDAVFLGGSCYGTASLAAYEMTPCPISMVIATPLQWHSATSLQWGTSSMVNATSVPVTDNCMKVSWTFGDQ